jgi:Right handed beta helix region
MAQRTLVRRRFLSAMAGSIAFGPGLILKARDDRPPVTQPRATDGDDRAEPAWDERLTVTVGTEGKKCDLIGRDDKVIQAALDYVARFGGGTVRLLPGVFTLRNAVVLPSRVRLLGSGADTIVTKVPSISVALADDSDWYDREITLRDARGFQVGDGVVLRATNPDDGGPVVIKRTLVARSGNRFRLDSGLRENLWTRGEPTCASLFPLLTAERAADVVVEKLTLDGDKANNTRLDGNYAGCIFLQDCNRFTFRGVTARNYNGDGISFQIAHDVVVENCHSHDNADLGLHAGSGSQRPIMRDNRLERNGIGLYFCWGVKYGLASKNLVVGNRNYGISIGHHDTDNLILDNAVRESGKIGVLFRDESRGKDFWPNRNRLESNRIENSGGDDGVAIAVEGKTRELKIRGNDVRESRGPARRCGLRLAKDVGAIALADNKFEGFAKDVDDLRTSRGGGLIRLSK